MPSVLRIALLGFTEFERQAFQTFFAHAAGVGPTHELVPDLRSADGAVADAQDPIAYERLSAAGMLSRAIFLGATPRPGAALQLPRPINLALVLRGLDTIAGSRATGQSDPMPLQAAPAPATRQPRAPAAHPGQAAPSTSTPPVGTAAQGSTPPPSAPPPRQRAALSPVERVLEELAYRTVNLPGGVDMRTLAEAPAPTSPPAADHSSALPLEHVLVVSTDHGDYRCIVVSLQGFGFQMHLAPQAQAALQALTQRRYRYVFIDPRTPETDALMLCRVAREAGTGPGQEAGQREESASIVLLAHPDVDGEALRRALPAADATLRSPLARGELLKLVGDREVARYAFADTARTITRL
jgi:CheY-like chemotaxis protein